MLLFHLINLLFNNPVQFLITILVIIVPLFMSITFHEWAHGYAAYRFGDPTPKLQGRLTLNPFAHLDPLGTLMLFVIGIGWAKPVILNPLNYPGRKEQMFVALAGPAANILLAVVFAWVSAYLSFLNDSNVGLLVEPVNLIVRINLILAIFNLLPIPPLDGSSVLAWILPEKFRDYYLALAPFGLFILLFILFAGGLEIISTSAAFVQAKLTYFLSLLIEGL